MIYFFKYWNKTIFLISAIALFSALIAEFFFSLSPCELCLKQRHPYYAIIVLFLLFYFFKIKKQIWLIIFNQIFILYGLFYSLWHLGIERNYIKGPSSCSGELLLANSLSDLKEQIMSQPIVSCNEIIWTIAGLSAATINSIMLLLILFFNTIYILNNIFYASKKNI